MPHSPIELMGTVTLWAALLVASYSVAAGIIGNSQKKMGMVRSSVLSIHALCALSMLASSLIIYAFVSHDYSIKYVAKYSDSSMPLYYKIAAYWGGLDGSLMFWVAVLSVFSSIAVSANARRHRDMIGYVVATIGCVQVFFLSLLLFTDDPSRNPFQTYLTHAPIDGEGLNPLLQTYWMTIHPPSLYTGFVSATIPFAFGIGALASGRLDTKWLQSVRGWTFLCWFFLSFGLILGGRWAYEELGWGGYWAWDPVENAGLLPWFTATAFLHSVIIQEQRGMLRVWNMVLVITTFFLTIFGTFMTRSGVVQSVHAFGEDNALALLFILFMGFILVMSFGLLFFRLPLLRSKTSFDSFYSREFAFLLNNWILLASAFFVLFATMFPTLSQALNGQRITVGPPFFNKIMIPVGLVLVFLAGAAPLLAWRQNKPSRLWGQFRMPLAVMCLAVGAIAVFVPESRDLHSLFWVERKGMFSIKAPVTLINFGVISFTLASIWQEFWGGARVRMKQTGGDPITSTIGILLTKRRKYGGYIIHAAIAVMFFGFGGRAFEVEKSFTVKAGESFSVRNYRFNYERFEVDNTTSDYMTRYYAKVSVDGFDAKTRKPTHLFDLFPEKRNYNKNKSEQPTTEPAVKSMLKEDVYLVLEGFQEETADKVAVFRVFINPLVNWVWLGFGLLMLGTLFCILKQSWVDAILPSKNSRIGKAAELGLWVLVLSGLLSFGNTAFAQGGGEHQMGGNHNPGATAAATNREDDARLMAPYRQKAIKEIDKAGKLKDGTPEFERAIQERLAPIVSFNAKIMKDLVCLCGGCTRENLHQCTCGFAAGERGEILSILAKHDLWTEAGRDVAREDVMNSMVAKHENKKAGEGQMVLMVPPRSGFNRLAVWIPYVGIVFGLAGLFFLGRKWKTNSGNEVSHVKIASTTEGQRHYEDLLEDELRETD